MIFDPPDRPSPLHRRVSDSHRARRPHRIRSLACALACALIAPLAAPFARAAAPDEVVAEAARRWAEAEARRGEPGGPVDLLRVVELAPHLPRGWLTPRLQRAAEDRQRPPLTRAVALELLRREALDRFDIRDAQSAADRLGLLTAFAWRPGAAPHPIAALSDDEFLPWPAHLEPGELRLDAVARPSRDAVATVVTRLDAARGGAAVLRLGYDDAVTVWLNGDELYVSPAPHRAWLDQAAIPIALRPGNNRLVIEVRQRTGAWRLLVRVTDAAGEPWPVTAHPDPWGPSPEPAEIDPPTDVAHLWSALLPAAEVEPPPPVALRDLADYARVTGLPDDDQMVPRVAIESAWLSDPSPRTLAAWLAILPDELRAEVRAAFRPTRPIDAGDVYADRALRLADGWDHFYGRRHRDARLVAEQLIEEAPGFHLAHALLAVILEDVGLNHAAAAHLSWARQSWPESVALRRAQVIALRGAGRIAEALDALQGAVDAATASYDERFELATLRIRRGELDEGVALLDELVALRPALWTPALEAVDALTAEGRLADAEARLQRLAALAPGDPAVDERRGRLHLQMGQPDLALAPLRSALAATGDPDLARLVADLDARPPLQPLGPPVTELVARPDPPGVAAHVLYHHARAEVGADGRATRRVRRVVRLATEEGARRFAEWELPYVPGSQVLEIEAATLHRAGEPPATPERTDRDLSEPEFRLYYDLRAEVLSFPRPRPGDVLEVAWRLSDAEPDPSFPDYFGELAYLQEMVPRAESVVELGGAGRSRLQVALIDYGLSVTRVEDPEGWTRFAARAVPASPVEARMPGPSSLRAHVHASTLSGWSELDARYRALLGERAAPTAELGRVARDWIGDATEPAEQLARLYTAVAHRTRYVGLELGVRSFRPELPAVTLARGYGDCKDKATLLIALARAVGIEAHLVLVRTRGAGHVASTPASFAVFDHAAVYVPALDRFLDPTVDRNDPWTLPPSDQGAVGFVVGLDTAPRIIPAASADAERSEWQVEGALDASGVLTGQATWTTRGQAATVARRALEAAGARRETLASRLARLLPGVSLGEPTISGVLPARDPLIAQSDTVAPFARSTSSGWRVPFTGAPWGLVGRYARSATRATPLQLPPPGHERLSLRLALPAHGRVEVPAPRTLESPFGRFVRTATVEGDALNLETELVRHATEVAPADYPAFRAWLSAIDDALSATVEVHR